MSADQADSQPVRVLLRQVTHHLFAVTSIQLKLIDQLMDVVRGLVLKSRSDQSVNQ